MVVAVDPRTLDLVSRNNGGKQAGNKRENPRVRNVFEMDRHMNMIKTASLTDEGSDASYNLY